MGLALDLSCASDSQRAPVLPGGQNGQHDPVPDSLDWILGLRNASGRLADFEEARGQVTRRCRAFGPKSSAVTAFVWAAIREQAHTASHGSD